jgi:WD40 repeat protein
MKDFQKLLIQLMLKNFLFGMNNGLKKLGFDQYCDLAILPDILHLNNVLLISRSSIMLWLIVKLFHHKVRPLFRRGLKIRLIRYVCSPVLLSFIPRSCYFERFVVFNVDPTYSIDHIYLHPRSYFEKVLILQVKTSSKLHRPKTFTRDDKIIHFNLETNERSYLLGPKSTQDNFPIYSKQGEYSAKAGDDPMNNSIVFVTFRSIRRMILAHFSKVSAIAFHPSLPLMVTCDINVKHAKLWYIPSELCSDPVLISILHTHDLIVSSIVFHPVLPIVFFGGTNGTIQVWRAI